MKRFLSLLLILLLAISLFTACGDPEVPDEDAGEENGDDVTTDGGNEGESTGDTPSPTVYTISWLDSSGASLGTTTVTEGSAPTFNYTPEDTAEWGYTLDGWASEPGGSPLDTIPAATSDASYYAVISQTKRCYTVSFNTKGGSEVSPLTLEYGSGVTLPEAPEMENHRFIGWCTDDACTTAFDVNATVTGDLTLYASWNRVIDAKALLASLLNGYKLDPLSFIPASMLPSSEANLVNPSEIVSDYSSFVDVSSITYGYGEQWKMVLDNLLESEIFFNALGIVESISASSVTIFNNYFDSNPADTAHHEFETSGYNVTVKIDGEYVFFIVEYIANLPVIGEQAAQIALCMELDSGARTVRIQLGDANALSYTATENSYEFAIKYLGVRRAFFNVSRDADGNISGKIYEFLTVAGKDIASAAEFYATDDYVSVVGNKADAYIGATGYINELYDAETGRMLGYEIREESSIPIVGTVTFNTLWFNLADVDGANTIKYAESGDSGAFYINGKSGAWTAMKVGGNILTNHKAQSRRFDIEFRAQYVYSYDAASESYTVHAVTVPMLFIQEEYYESMTSDILSTNGVSLTVDVSTSDFNKLTSDYKTLIPVFIEHKSAVGSEDIVSYIGNKYDF